MDPPAVDHVALHGVSHHRHRAVEQRVGQRRRPEARRNEAEAQRRVLQIAGDDEIDRDKRRDERKRDRRAFSVGRCLSLVEMNSILASS